MNQTLMVQGTSSDAGKSLLVTALCRLYARQGWAVAPFKPQNMALNSAVTADGGEIGRAQAVQALAAGLAPEVDFNPVLLKPSSDTGAQVIIHGRALSDMEAGAYHDYKRVALQAVLDSHRRLQGRFQRIVVEGAGSPAEVNLRAGDIANMGFAEAVDCPVILVADIDRGGVFAQLVGTLALLSESEQARIRGFVINKFRGDLALLQPGLDWLEQRTGKPVLGVLPYLHGLDIAAEDAIDARQAAKAQVRCKVVVPVLSRISNHTDFDPLRRHPQIDLQFAGPGAPLPACDLIILPGSKNVRRDLDFLRAQGWDSDIDRHLRYGGKLFGICGGYQMLGRQIRDPRGVEDHPGKSRGLGYLPMETELAASKQLRQCTGSLLLGPEAVAVTGYEIHVGVSTLQAGVPPLYRLQTGTDATPYPDGGQSPDGQVAGGYLHGPFDAPTALQAVLAWAGIDIDAGDDYQQQQRAAIERLTDCCEQHLDLKRLESLFNEQWRLPHG